MDRRQEGAGREADRIGTGGIGMSWFLVAVKKYAVFEGQAVKDAA